MLTEYRQSKISIVQARCYLKYLGLNNDIINKIVNNKNEEYHVPSSWYNHNDIDIYENVPMHLLMLGLVKSVMIKIGKWLRERNLNSKFVKISHGILGSIKSLNVEWCKILEYPKTEKTGGWVSENFLAMSRIGLWFYSLLSHIPCNNNEQIEAENIMNLVHSMCLLLQKCMSLKTNKSDIIHLEAIIRMFLIYYDIIDMEINDEPNIPSWISQYNMLCLLNLPNTIRKYGYIRNIWEGGTEGESYLKHVKKQLSAGLVNQWQVWVITNLLKEDIYRDWKTVSITNNSLRNQIKIYGSMDDARMSFNSGHPISLLIYNNNKYICYRKSGAIKGVRIKLSNKEILPFNQIYYSMQWSNTKVTIDTTNTTFLRVIMLPLLGVTSYVVKDDSTKYCMIRSDWE
jgi:hypothetical protein